MQNKIQEMVEHEKALEVVLGSAAIIGVEQIGFQSSLGRVMAKDVISDIDMPPFNKSAMDGFACRFEDLENELEVLEVIPAGKAPRKVIGENQCSKIMTGSELPKGADCVIMVEQTEETASKKIRFTAEKTKPNFVPRGEDVKKGDRLIERGNLVKPQHIAVMASVGCTQPLVYKKPAVGILSTGDELVEPATLPGASQIRNSNAYQLVAQTGRIGCQARYFGIARDEEDHSREMIQKALSESDVVLLTGGVSMGDFDYIPAVLKQMGIEIIFKSVAVQPGRPTVFATNGQKYIFGLPGNPVSSFNIFELLVKPLLYKIQGSDYQPLMIRMPLGKDYNRKKSSRKSFIPVRINEKAEVIPIDYHGSAHVHALVFADGLISIPIGCMELKKGELVDVRQI